MSNFTRIKSSGSLAYSYFRLPKALFTDKERFAGISVDAILLYSIFLDRTALSIKHEWIDENDDVYIIAPHKEMQDLTGFSKNKIGRLYNELLEVMLISLESQGISKPNRMYVNVIENVELSTSSSMPQNRES
ncbi:MAG: replication initiator protein A [Clostridiales Family XIII bacterium]|jgi:hypothetical protein|nr:replication initiator protein A [Clostridiales Family XIII bacterium]